MSLVFNARYYSGQVSADQDFTATIDDNGWLNLQGSDIAPAHLKDIDISPRVGNSMRYLTLPDGAAIETADNDVIDEAARRWGVANSSHLHWLERSTKITAAAIVVLVIGAYLFVTRGIPALAAVTTAMLPTSLDDRLGGEVLEQLDGLVFAETQLDNSRQQELTTLFDTLVPVDARDFKLEFRSSEILGANAIALPNAQIVFTDQLINLAEDDEMIAGIMLHEIGHVIERHSMQAVVRQAGLSVLIVALTGDVNTAATTLLVLLPSVLIQSQYSRNLEWSADTYALDQMLTRGLDTEKFADIMERMTMPDGVDSEVEDQAIATENEEGSVFEYFSSHPATAERIQRFREASR